jgi:hypothetical protein
MFVTAGGSIACAQCCAVSGDEQMYGVDTPTRTYINPDVRRRLKLDEVGRSRRLGKLKVSKDHIRSFL